MSSRMRNSTARPTPSRASIASSQIPASSAAADALPPYKKPSHPLTAPAQDKIKALNGRSISIIQKHATEAGKRIAGVAGVINDRLREHEEQIAKRQKLWERGIDTEDQEDEEVALKILQGKVDDMTKQLEGSMRSIIDSGAAVERMEESLTWLHANAPVRLQDEYTNQMSQLATQRESQSQRQHRRQAAEENDDEEMGGASEDEGPTPGPTPLDGSRPVLTGIGEILSERLNRKKTEYTSQSLGRRYADNPAYANFKGIVHDAKYQDDRPLPDRTTWFTDAGTPAPGITAGRGDDDDDDDIVMDRATISTRCPLTFQQFKEPLTSTKCPHTFEKNAILDMIRASRTRVGGGPRGGAPALQCPVSGCSQMLTREDLKEDPILMRKLQRMIRAEKDAAEESEPEDAAEDVEAHRSRQPQSSTRIKPEPSSRQQPQQSSIVEDLGSPSGSEDEDEDEL